jgi:DNA-binding protein YbaB
MTNSRLENTGKGGIPGPGAILDPDAAMDWLSAWKGKIDKVAADTKAMSDSLQMLQVTETDKSGQVRVTVDSTGALKDLWFGHHVQRISPEVLARTVMDTIRAARKKLADQAELIVAETVGIDSAAGRTIATRVGQQLRGPELDTEKTGDQRGWR